MYCEYINISAKTAYIFLFYFINKVGERESKPNKKPQEHFNREKKIDPIVSGNNRDNSGGENSLFHLVVEMCKFQHCIS